MKFLHSADWQMGMKAIQAGEKAKEVRSQRFETASRIVSLAKQEHVDFVLLAGDLFEDHDVDESVVRKTVTLLNSFDPIPVFVLPGNHDPVVAGSIWDRQSWRQVSDNVILLAKAEEMPINQEAVIYPSPLRQKQSTVDPTAWIPLRERGDNRIRIGVAHGSLDLLPERGNFPISSERVEKTGLDYLALGDWHGFMQHAKAVYSGTMEQTGFNESDPGNVVIVQIAKGGDDPVIYKQRVGKFVWSEYRPLIRDVSDVHQLRDEIMVNDALDERLIRVMPDFSPDFSEEVVSELEGLRKELVDETFLLDWSEESIDPPIDTKTPIPNGALSDVDSCLAAILDGKIPDGPGREFASVNPTVVREARALLRRLVREVQP